jgi:hypothetical protein
LRDFSFLAVVGIFPNSFQQFSAASPRMGGLEKSRAIFKIQISQLQNVQIPVRLNVPFPSSSVHICDHVNAVKVVDVVIVVVVIIVVVVVDDADDVEDGCDADDSEGQKLKGRKTRSRRGTTFVVGSAFERADRFTTKMCQVIHFGEKFKEIFFLENVK